MKSLIAAVLLMFSMSVFAQVNVDTRGLSDSQKAELVKMAEGMKATTPMDNVDKVDKWITAGERFGKMMGGAAKEVGIAVNDFVKTPVGMMTAALIVWNYMGGMIVHVASGWALLMASWGLLFWYSKRVTALEITYDQKAGKNWLGRYPILKVERSKMDGELFGFILLGYAISGIISVWTMFAW